MDLEQDTHICLVCQSTIVGLENYVQHKRNECPLQKQHVTKPKDQQSTVLHSQSIHAHHATIQPAPDTGNADHLLFNNSGMNESHGNELDASTGIVESQAAQFGNFSNCSLTPSNTVGFSPLAFGSPGNSFSRNRNFGIMSPLCSGLSPTQNIQNTQVIPPISQHGLIGLSSPSRGLTNFQPSSQTQHTDALGVEVSEAVASLVSSTLSPTSNRTIDPNDAFYGSAASSKDAQDVADFMSFFNSLELQSKSSFDSNRPSEKINEQNIDQPKDTNSSVVNQVDDERMDHQKALRIANILNELAFSSDSEDFHVPSDADNLLNSDNEIEHEGNDDINRMEEQVSEEGKDKQENGDRNTVASQSDLNWIPEPYHSSPSNVTGGKWKPSSKLQAMSDARDQMSLYQMPPEIPSKSDGINKTNKKLQFTDSAESKIHSHIKIGGKWKPGQRPSGKWRPGEGPKYRRPDTDEEEEEEEEDNVDPDSEEIAFGQRGGKGKGAKIFFTGKLSRGKILPINPDSESDNSRLGEDDMKDVTKNRKQFCTPCKRTLYSTASYDRHIKSAYHYKRTHSHRKFTKESEPIECTICKKSFNYKYNFARHLVSSQHMRRAELCKNPMLLDESCQVLLLRQSRFQCHVCSFYCTKAEDLLQHINTQEHGECSGNLIGPLLCVRCKFACSSNEQMVHHIESSEHRHVIEMATRPCIIKESRHKVKCPKCELILHSATQLKGHLKLKHNKEDKYQKKANQKPYCSYCGKRWKSLYAMEIHIRRIHTKEKPFKCSYCMVAFADKNTLNLHNKSQKHINKIVEISINASKAVCGESPITQKQKTKLYKCNHCEFKCYQYSDLRPHYMDCHAREMYACDACSLTFMDKKQYDVHMKSKAHKDHEKYKEEGTKTHRCEHCGKTYLNFKKKQLHELTHNYVITEAAAKKQVGPFFGIDPRFHDFLDSLSNIAHGTVVKCPECNKSLTKQNMNPHLRSHTKSTPFLCMLCNNKSFNSALSLRRHLMYHMDIRMYPCKECGNEFMKRSQLEQHRQLQHNPNAEKKFHCSKCSASFVIEDQLRRHRAIHDAPILRCSSEGCRYSTHIRADLTIHMTSHTDARPFLCEECGWRAKTKKSYKAHLRTHSGERKFHCEYCEYKANTKHHLHRHMRIHIGSKPYKCPYCQYRCNTLDNLQKHITRTSKHKGLYLYNCKSCVFGSNNVKEFKDHMFNLHGIEDKDLGQVCSTLGIYNKSKDVRDIPEGECAIPLKERLVAGPKCKKQCKVNKNSVISSDICETVPEPNAEEIVVEHVEEVAVEEEDELSVVVKKTLEAWNDHSYVSYQAIHESIDN